MTTARDSLFVCYAREDRTWRERLLRALPDHVSVSAWHDGRIDPGERWEEEIAAALRRTKAAVLIVSRAFFASDFIRNTELPELERASDENQLTLLWLPVAKSNFENSVVASYQALLDPARPLAELANEEATRLLKRAAEKIDASLRGRRVLVAGSEANQQRQSLFRKNCEQLGQALAKEGFTIVAGSHREVTADRHVLEGADRANVPNVPVIRVGTQLGFSERDRIRSTNLQELDFYMQKSWYDSRPQQVANADVVVLLGGRRGTADIAYEAAWQHRPTIPAVSLGGTARKWRKVLSRRLQRLGAPAAEVEALNGPFDVDPIMALIRRFTPKQK